MNTMLENKIRRLDRTYIANVMPVKLMENCPLSTQLRFCHPSCNWWDSEKCSYHIRSSVTTGLLKLEEKVQNELPVTYSI